MIKLKKTTTNHKRSVSTDVTDLESGKHSFVHLVLLILIVLLLNLIDILQFSLFDCKLDDCGHVVEANLYYCIVLNIRLFHVIFRAFVLNHEV